MSYCCGKGVGYRDMSHELQTVFSRRSTLPSHWHFGMTNQSSAFAQANLLYHSQDTMIETSFRSQCASLYLWSRERQQQAGGEGKGILYFFSQKSKHLVTKYHIFFCFRLAIEKQKRNMHRWIYNIAVLTCVFVGETFSGELADGVFVWPLYQTQTSTDYI